MRNLIWIGAAAVVVVLLVGIWVASPDDTSVVDTTMATDDTVVTEDTLATDTSGVDSDTAEVAGSDVGAASNAATDEAVAEIAEGDAPTSEETVTESREIASAEGVVGAEALQPETFDMERVILLMDESDLTESERDVWLMELENAEEDPEQLASVLEDLRTALNVE